MKNGHLFSAKREYAVDNSTLLFFENVLKLLNKYQIVLLYNSVITVRKYESYMFYIFFFILTNSYIF